MLLFPCMKKHTSEQYCFSREVNQADYMHDSVRNIAVREEKECRGERDRAKCLHSLLTDVMLIDILFEKISC